MNPDYKIEATSEPTFYFVGVTTGQSLSARLFPHWMAALDRPEVKLAGVDLPLQAKPARYRQVVAQIKNDPQAMGGLVTSHKIDLLEAAEDMFDRLTEHARLCHEVSSLAKPAGQLEGHTVDPDASGRSLRALTGEGYFAQTGGHILCLGAGGAATALTVHLFSQMEPDDRPERLQLVDRAEARLKRLERLVDQFETEIDVEYILNEDPHQNDALMARLPQGSLVINATGLGKDRPGSPLSDAGQFPRNGIAWELNYRGERPFLHQALAQQEARNLTVEDGWRYFLYGWTSVLSHVLGVIINSATFDELAALAEELRR